MSINTYPTKTAIIYIYINLCSPTLKSYVGITTNFRRRKHEHKRDSENSNGYFHRAIKKHGWQNFVCFVLDKTVNIEYARTELEPYYIKLCKSFYTENGYNLTLGGEGNSGLICTEETKQKISKKLLGHTHSKKSKLKMCESHKGLLHSKDTKFKIGKSNRGKTVSEQTKQRISNSRKGTVFSEEHKANISKSLLGKKRGPYKLKSR
jgi:group I intron endonuclease